jgi:hypothetical protein
MLKTSRPVDMFFIIIVTKNFSTTTYNNTEVEKVADIARTCNVVPGYQQVI